MRLTQKGQVTVPKRLRERFGLRRGTEVEFEATDRGVLLRPASNERAERLAGRIAAVRGTADAGLGTAEIMRLTRE